MDSLRRGQKRLELLRYLDTIQIRFTHNMLDYHITLVRLHTFIYLPVIATYHNFDKGAHGCIIKHFIPIHMITKI